jgi:FtsP/CotA-like multicopper oxidase with cupredoxin domain
MGNEVDIHTAHWHGVTALDHGVRTDVVELTPAIFKTVDMAPDVAGVWLFHCHVADHMMAGMMARFEVTP